MTMEQVVTQLRQEVFTLKAQVADQSGLSDAVRAINVLGTAQAKKDTPSLIDVKGLGRRRSLAKRGFSTMVEEDGSVLCVRDPGV